MTDDETAVDRMLDRPPIYRGGKGDELKMKAEIKARIAPQCADYYLGDSSGV